MGPIDNIQFRDYVLNIFLAVYLPKNLLNIQYNWSTVFVKEKKTRRKYLIKVQFLTKVIL